MKERWQMPSKQLRARQTLKTNKQTKSSSPQDVAENSCFIEPLNMCKTTYTMLYIIFSKIIQKEHELD